MVVRTEKRKHARFKAKWPFSIVLGNQTIAGLTEDFSEIGFLISASQPLRLNEKYKIVISPPNRKNLKLSCEVIRSDLYGIDPEDAVFGIGTCFLKVAEKDRRLLSDFVSGLRTRR